MREGLGPTMHHRTEIEGKAWLSNAEHLLRCVGFSSGGWLETCTDHHQLHFQIEASLLALGTHSDKKSLGGQPRSGDPLHHLQILRE